MTTIAEIEKYWDSRPCNVRHSDAPIGSARWSAEVTNRKYFVEPHIPGFAQFERWKWKRVLEIGCGIGTDSLEFLRAGAFVDAVDISEDSLALARRRAEMAGNVAAGFGFHHMNAEERLPGFHDEYDLVYSFGMLHHTLHPFKVLWLAHNRLKDDGELHVMVYAKWSIKNLLGWQPEAQVGCPLARRYTMAGIMALVEQAGFKVISIQKTHIFPYRLKDYIEHRYVKRLAYRIMPGWFFRWLESEFGDHILLVARKGASCSR